MGTLKDEHKKHPTLGKRKKKLDFSRAKTINERATLIDRERIRKKSLGLLRL